jgi:3',5'-cyclic AMP phosphodiesterase CpdA
MRIVCISDTHMRHGIDIPYGDILLHAGDATFHGYRHEVEEFGEWFGSQPHMHKVFIAGNHDTSFEDSPNQARAWLEKASDGQIIYLQDSFVNLEVDGETVKVYGAPWQPWFFDWAFNLRTDTELKSKWDRIPKNTDILITHGPPYKLCDITMRGEHVGCRELRKAIQRVRPKLHVCGHIHEGYGVEEWMGVTIANASICNARYNPVHEPLVFELKDGILRDTQEIQGEEETD